jgi:hypothetical protein
VAVTPPTSETAGMKPAALALLPLRGRPSLPARDHRHRGPLVPALRPVLPRRGTRPTSRSPASGVTTTRQTGGSSSLRARHRRDQITPAEVVTDRSGMCTRSSWTSCSQLHGIAPSSTPTTMSRPITAAWSHGCDRCQDSSRTIAPGSSLPAMRSCRTSAEVTTNWRSRCRSAGG